MLRDAVKLRYKLKKRQVKALKRFAQMMKWPNLREMLANLRQRDAEFSLDTISSDAFAYFSGLVVPGVCQKLHRFVLLSRLIEIEKRSEEVEKSC